MNKKPRNPSEPIINKHMQGSVAFRSIFLAISALGAFLIGLYAIGIGPQDSYSLTLAISMCFFTLVAGELLIAFTSKTEAFSGFGRDLFKNKFLNISMSASLLILVAVMYIPILNDWFSTIPLSLTQVAICLGLVAIPILGSEFSKKLMKAE